MASKPTRPAVPYPVTNPARIPAQRYYDAEFYAMEKKHLWPRVWQMACRLEEIPEVGDYTVYRNLDQSIIVIRTAPDTIKAFHNHCRHRGVELAQSTGKARGGFICPFHGWRWDKDGNNIFVFEAESFPEASMCKDDLALRPVRLETYLNCAFINLDDNAPPLRETTGMFGRKMDLFKAEQMRTEWWHAARVPCNWKLAMEAFMEGYHVATTHPQLLPKGSTNRPGESRYLQLPDDAVTGSFWITVGAHMPDQVEPADFIDQYIEAMRLIREGMAGMVSELEMEVANSLRDIDLPRAPAAAAAAFRTALNNAIMDRYRADGMDIGDINELDRLRLATNVNFCFPHFFLLPMWGAAASYRIRPLGPEECLFELWSLRRYPEGQEPPRPSPPVAKPADDPSWPPIPKQDYANLPRQQRGLHTGGFEFMRLSDQVEGLISNFHRLLDGYLSGVPDAQLTRAMDVVSGPIDIPIHADMGF